MRATLIVGILLCSPLVALPVRSQDLPRMDWDREVLCVVDSQKGELRVQLDESAPGGCVCLVAKNFIEGQGSELNRTQVCRWVELVQYQELLSRCRQVPAIAEAPPGWHRDERGRVFQVTFDLQDRFYLGAHWLPTFIMGSDATAQLARVKFDMGFSASVFLPKERQRHTFRAIEGSVSLGPLEAEGTLFAYDLSHRSDRPLLWITTFFGQPVRHDLFMDIGMGLRLLGVQLHPHRLQDVTAVEFGEAHVAWEIWQSSDLYNFVRLETGLGVSGLYRENDGPDVLSLVPNVALLGRFCLDAAGFHTISTRLFWEKPLALSGVEGGTDWTRSGANLAYEVIFLAVNDQPLTLRLETQADYRDDLGPGVPPFEARVMAGMRFSFWAPALVRQKPSAS